jgi:hypothetical protein
VNPTLNLSRKFELTLEHLTMSLLPISLISEPERPPSKTLNCLPTRSTSRTCRSQNDTFAIWRRQNNSRILSHWIPCYKKEERLVKIQLCKTLLHWWNLLLRNMESAKDRRKFTFILYTYTCIYSIESKLTNMRICYAVV